MRSVDDIIEEVGVQAETHENVQSQMSERLISRFGRAMRRVAMIPFILLSEHETGSGGKVYMPRPNVFDFDDPGGEGSVTAPGGGGNSPKPPGGGGSSTPKPPDNPLPVPTPSGAGVPNNALDIVVAVRSHYGTPLRSSNLLAFLRETAKALGPDAGLLFKDWGANVSGYAQDIICFKNGDIYDVLVSVETKASPAWQYAGRVDPSRWREP